MCIQNRPKQPVSAENSVSAETPKREKTKMPKPKPKQAEIFGRNGTETVSDFLVSHKTVGIHLSTISTYAVDIW